MFIGSWIINVTISFIAFLFVFIGSLSVNTLPTTLFRSCLAFLFFFIFTYFIRWLLMFASKENNSKTEEKKADIEEREQGEATLKDDYTKEDIQKASQYVKDLINN